MRVLIINPHRSLRFPKEQFISPPTGIMGLASWLERNRFNVEIIDCPIEDYYHWKLQTSGAYRCGIPDHKLVEKIKEFRPDVVGISCVFTARFKNVEYISALVKGIDPAIPVVVGGMHATMRAEEVLESPFIDYVVMGEAELPFLELLKSNFTSRRAVSVKGNISNERWMADDINIFPFPAYYLIDLEQYFRINHGRDALSTERRWASVITSRGCPLQCSYCGAHNFWGHKWRGRHPDHVLDEIERLVEIYGIREISFDDDNITTDYSRAEAIFKGIIDRGLKFKWNAPNGVAVHHIDRPLAKLMKQSGCTRLNFGIESGDEYVLHTLMNKKVSLDKVREVIKIVHETGIVTLAYFVLGMPGETPKSIATSLKFAKSIPLDEIGIQFAIPYPGTALEKTSKESGYLIKDFTMVETEEETGCTVFMETPLLSSGELQRLKDHFVRSFYTSKIFKNPMRCAWRVLKKPSLVRRFLCGERKLR